MTKEEREALVESAMDQCAQLRDEEHPASWPKDYREGFIAGCDNCLSMIHNVLMYEKTK